MVSAVGTSYVISSAMLIATFCAFHNSTTSLVVGIAVPPSDEACSDAACLSTDTAESNSRNRALGSAASRLAASGTGSMSRAMSSRPGAFSPGDGHFGQAPKCLYPWEISRGPAILAATSPRHDHPVRVGRLRHLPSQSRLADARLAPHEDQTAASPAGVR